MARAVGTPGESAAFQGLLRICAVCGMYGLIVIPASFWVVRNLGTEAGVLGLLVGTGMIAALIRWRRRDLALALESLSEGGNFLKGARGEILVHQALQALPDEYIVFNDFHPIDATSGVPVRWNVDHIVIGPAGVFVLDAKYYRRPFVPCASKSSFSRKNVKQAQRNAMNLKDGLTRWSAGDLANLFVVPIVVYAQPDASLQRLREGVVRTIPLRLLVREIQTHAEPAIDQEKAGRIARVLFAQIASDLQCKFKPEFDGYGELSKAARYAARDQRLAARQGEQPDVPTPPVACSLCGAKLVRRIARHGARAGKPFLGCANYHSNGCRYGFDLDE